MAAALTLRCSNCGTAYEMPPPWKSVSTVCTVCQTNVQLQPETPLGLLGGRLPPLHVSLTLIGCLVFTLLAARVSFFAILAFGLVIYLLVDVLQSIQRRRAEAVPSWEHLRNTFAVLTQTKQALAQSDERYQAISPERRDTLAKEIETQKNTLHVLGDLDSLNTEKSLLQTTLDALKADIVKQQETLKVCGDLAALNAVKTSLEGRVTELKKRVVTLEEDELLQSFGFYKPMYNLTDSQAYARTIEALRAKQKTMVKEGTALFSPIGFTIDGDKARGKKFVKNMEKLVLRAFNGECDATIDKVTFSNLGAIKARLEKCYHDINDLCGSVGIGIVGSYLNAKVEELHLNYEYQMKLKDEKDEQRKIREQMREQARLIKEIEEARQKIEKEETHFNQAIAELRARMEAAAEHEREQYAAKLKEYETKLAAVQKDKEEVAFREKSTRAGYIYVISNIGAFGEDVYKIGMTRRLEPQERIDELGDASVPFEFDVHAMIFSENAPTLEAALHRQFEARALNKINARKEFFRVGLSEIEDVVRKNHNAVVEFTRIARAEHYRLSLAKEGNLTAGEKSVVGA